jgi:hypothetical protein
MKKIMSKYKRKKSERQKQIIVSVILIGILLVSTVGFAFQGTDNSEENNQNTIKYNGYDFIEQSGYWLTEIQDVSFIFQYNPEQIQNTNSFINLLDNYYDKPLYIHSQNSLAESEIYSNLGQLVVRVQRACLEDTECDYEDVPIKTCEDNFIIIEEAEENNIIQDGNCVYIQGSEQELIKLADEFLFKILGIN